MSGIISLLLSGFGASNAPVGFLASITNSNGSQVTNPNIALRNDQLNLSANTSASGTNQLVVARLGLDGSITWQTALADASDYPFGGGIEIDSGGNVAIAGGKYDSLNGIVTGYVVKLNGSGTVQWQRRINGNTQFYAVAIDASDSLYAAGIGNLFTTATSDIYVSKFNSSGDIQYRRNIGSTSTVSEAAYGIAIRSSTEFVLTGLKGSGGFAFFDGYYLSCSQSTGETSSGLDQRDPEGNKRQEGTSVIAGESSGIFYNAVIVYNSSGIGSASLVKYGSAGTITWQALLSQGSSGITFSSLCMDPSGTHIYACGTMTTSGARVGSNVQIAKYRASDGQLMWQRSLSSPVNNEYLSGVSIRVDSLDNIYVTVSQSLSGVNRSFLLKMPGSGAGAGNSAQLGSTVYTYNQTSHSSSGGTLIGSNYAPTNSSSSQPILTPAASSSTGTLAVTGTPL